MILVRWRPTETAASMAILDYPASPSLSCRLLHNNTVGKEVDGFAPRGFATLSRPPKKQNQTDPVPYWG